MERNNRNKRGYSTTKVIFLKKMIINKIRWGHTSIMKDSNTMVIFGGYGLTFYNDIYSFNFGKIFMFPLI